MIGAADEGGFQRLQAYDSQPPQQRVERLGRDSGRGGNHDLVWHEAGSARRGAEACPMGRAGRAVIGRAVAGAGRAGRRHRPGCRPGLAAGRKKLLCRNPADRPEEGGERGGPHLLRRQLAMKDGGGDDGRRGGDEDAAQQIPADRRQRLARRRRDRARRRRRPRLHDDRIGRSWQGRPGRRRPRNVLRFRRSRHHGGDQHRGRHRQGSDNADRAEQARREGEGRSGFCPAC